MSRTLLRDLGLDFVHMVLPRHQKSMLGDFSIYSKTVLYGIGRQPFQRGAGCGAAGSALQCAESASTAARFPVPVGANNMLNAVVAFVAGSASCVLYCRRLASGVEGVRQNDWGAPRRKGRPFA